MFDNARKCLEVVRFLLFMLCRSCIITHPVLSLACAKENYFNYVMFCICFCVLLPFFCIYIIILEVGNTFSVFGNARKCLNYV